MKSKRNMNNLQRHLSACLLATVALLGGTSPAWADVLLGAASNFSVLGATVTCTTSTIAGDVGIAPATAFINTGCTIAGGMPPATDTAAAQARTDFLGAYDAARNTTCTAVLPSTITGPMTLTPGVYCTYAALTGTGVLTLDGQGNANAVWIFKIGTLATGALTGTNFSVVMAGGGQPCNVVWAPSAGVTMTTSTLKGNILAGNAIDGSITLTGGSLAGRALANVAVTMKDTSVIGCGALPPPPSCKSKKYCKHGKDCEDDKDHGDDEDEDCEDDKDDHGDD